jgi:hypothetical protein
MVSGLTPPHRSGNRLWSAVALAAVVALPSALLIATEGPYKVLHFNGLSTHDGIQYFAVSLDPLGRTPYCSQGFRYSRMLFPSAVYLVSTGCTRGLRALGCADWLDDTFWFEGYVFPHSILIQSYVYHGCLLACTWWCGRTLGRQLGSCFLPFGVVGAGLQAFVLKGLPTPLDVLLTAVTVRAIQRWSDAPALTWRRACGTGGLLAARLLNREAFLVAVAVLVACHRPSRGGRGFVKLGAALALGLVPPAVWYGTVGAVQRVNLYGRVFAFINADAKPVPLQGVVTSVAAGGWAAAALAGVAAYVALASARVGSAEVQRLRAGLPPSAAGLWSLVIFVTFFQAAAPLLATPFEYSRLLLLAPAVWADGQAVYYNLAQRLGRAGPPVAAVLAAGLMIALFSYFGPRYHDHLAAVQRRTLFLDRSWVVWFQGPAPVSPAAEEFRGAGGGKLVEAVPPCGV